MEPEEIKPEFLELVHYNQVSGTQGGKIEIDDKKLFSNLDQFKNPAVYRPLKLMLIIFFIAFIVSLFPTRPFITKIMKEIDLSDNQNESLVWTYKTVVSVMPILTTILNCSWQYFIIILGPSVRLDERGVCHSDCNCSSNREKIIDHVDVIDKHCFIVIAGRIHYFNKDRIFFIVSFDFLNIFMQHLLCWLLRNFVHSLDDPHWSFSQQVKYFYFYFYLLYSMLSLS